MSSSAPPHLVSIAEYQLSTHGVPVVAMTNEVAAAIQRAGLATRDHVVAALTTAADLAAPATTVRSTRLLETVISLSATWRELWLVYSGDVGGYVATWPR